MTPFKLVEIARNFNKRYPSLFDLNEFHNKTKYPDELGVYRAWMIEGIPCAFSEIPLLFEKIRDFVSQWIGVHPGDIKIVGSARTGYSLNPSKIGTQFSDKSDLDFAVVSYDYFLECEKQFTQFKNDYDNNLISPNNSNQARLWPEIIKDIERQRINMGFVDIWKIPTRPGYLTAYKAIQSCHEVTEKLRATSFGPKVKGCSIRVYRDTKSFIEQNNRTLRNVLAG